MPKEHPHSHDEEETQEQEGINKDRPLYVISVAAELVDMHPQTLRLYERKGLIEPRRSAGKTRLYSQRDIEHLREIRRLTQELGVNLAGVEEIIRLRRELDDLQDKMEENIGSLQTRIQRQLKTYKRELGPAQEVEESETGEGDADDSSEGDVGDRYD